MPSKLRFFYMRSSHCSDFSEYQKHRHQFKPVTPLSLEAPNDEKVKLKEENYPIKEGLAEIFPTLLGSGGMKYFELTQDPNGQPLKSDRPLRVSIPFYLRFFVK